MGLVVALVEAATVAAATVAVDEVALGAERGAVGDSCWSQVSPQPVPGQFLFSQGRRGRGR